jgi:hypothetical protein
MKLQHFIDKVQLPEFGCATDFERATGLARQTLAKRCRDGSLRHKLCGRTIIIRREDFLAWVKSTVKGTKDEHVTAT